jgi:hypothetical protein
MALQGALSCPVRQDLNLSGVTPRRAAIEPRGARRGASVAGMVRTRARQCDAGAVAQVPGVSVLGCLHGLTYLRRSTDLHDQSR